MPVPTLSMLPEFAGIPRTWRCEQSGVRGVRMQQRGCDIPSSLDENSITGLQHRRLIASAISWMEVEEAYRKR